MVEKAVVLLIVVAALVIVIIVGAVAVVLIEIKSIGGAKSISFGSDSSDSCSGSTFVSKSYTSCSI